VGARDPKNRGERKRVKPKNEGPPEISSSPSPNGQPHSKAAKCLPHVKQTDKPALPPFGLRRQSAAATALSQGNGQPQLQVHPKAVSRCACHRTPRRGRSDFSFQNFSVSAFAPMTRATFFKHFELLADQIDAVAKMRGLVLELAIRGQLVERNSKDEPAAKLLEKIKTEKREFLRANKLKESEVPPQISAVEVPFKCPSAWEWVRLGSISNRIHYGYTASADHSQQDVRLLRITDIQDNQVNWETVPGCQISAQEVAKYALHDNDILIARTGGTIGKTFLVASVAIKAVFASYLIRVIPSSQISARYLKLFLESPCYWRQLLAKSAGTGQPNVNGEALSGLCISLPPLAEQRRIVAKVDELMALCDELEQRQQARQHARAHLTQSAYHHLTTAKDPADFHHHFNFILQHSAFILDDVPQLRQAILQLAVQGRLVPQNPKDEPAEIKFGRNEELNANAPFEIPEQWTWTQLSQLADINGGFAFKSTDYADEGTRVVRISDFDEFGFKDHKVVRHPFTPDLQKFMLAEFNILMAMTGGTVGKSYFVKSLPEPMVVNQRVATIKVSATAIPSYVDIAIRSEMTQEVIQKAKNSTNDNISMGDIKGFAIPLPPLAEQKRIVARVEELLRWCDTLEAQLHQTRTLGAHLLASALHHLLAA
jgi:type I restriction enzyme S subunit